MFGLVSLFNDIKTFVGYLLPDQNFAFQIAMIPGERYGSTYGWIGIRDTVISQEVKLYIQNLMDLLRLFGGQDADFTNELLQ